MTLARVRLFWCLLLASVTPASAAAAAENVGLRVGTAKIDITPANDAALPLAGYGNRVLPAEAVHDPLHVRALVVDDGSNQAAIISVELIGLSTAFWEKLTARITQETSIRQDNVLLTVVHTHAAPEIRAQSPTGAGAAAAGPANEVAAKRAEYLTRVENAVAAAVQEAKSRLQPAKMGFGTGRANVNINRRARNADGGWGLGLNPDGASDKTVAVVKFETLAGEPFAIFANYGVHATVMGPSNLQVSSDLPGATSRFVEAHYGNKVVAAWTSGAGGDQAPIYDRNGTEFRHVAVLGQILGEEVVRVADSIQTSSRGRIRALQKVVSCPGKRTVQNPGPNREYKIEDADPVSIRLSLLMINDVAFAGVSGEVLTEIGQRLKRESPLARTILVTHCNGSSGYIPDDAAYDQVSFEIVVSRLKRGCAEDAIVNGLIEMMHEVW